MAIGSLRYQVAGRKVQLIHRMPFILISLLIVGFVSCSQATPAPSMNYSPNFKYAHLDTGIKMAYVEMGNEADQPVVLIHGVTDSFISFSQVAPRIAADGYYVIVPELRGHGHTDKPKEGPYSVEMHVADINALLNILNVKASNIIGHSLGSLIAQGISIQYPDKVSSLTLIATSSKAEENKVIVELRENINNWKDLPSDEFVRDWTVSSNYDPVLVEKTFEHAKQLPLYVWVNAFNGIATPVGLEKITVPVQIIRGSDDFFELNEHLDLIGRLNRSKYILFLPKQGYGHNTHWEGHLDEEIAADIVKFIEQVAKHQESEGLE